MRPATGGGTRAAGTPTIGRVERVGEVQDPSLAELTQQSRRQCTDAIRRGDDDDAGARTVGDELIELFELVVHVGGAQLVAQSADTVDDHHDLPVGRDQ